MSVAQHAKHTIVGNLKLALVHPKGRVHTPHDRFVNSTLCGVSVNPDTWRVTFWASKDRSTQCINCYQGRRKA